MHEVPNPEKDEDEEVDAAAGDSPDGGANAAVNPLQRDLPEGSYYYDDFYGYEVYDPDEDDENDQDP